MAKTATAANLSGSRTLQFTVEGIISLAWKKARMGGIMEEPLAAEQQWARHWIGVKLDSIAARAKITRTVFRHEITLVADDADYDLDASIYDVEGDAVYQDSGGRERTVAFMGRDEWNRVVFKDGTGTPTRYYPQKLATITVYPWPVPSAAATLIVQASKWIQSATAGNQTLDLERYFTEYMINALASEFAEQGGMDHADRLANKAEELLRYALGQSKQRGPAQFVMTHRTGWTK